MGVVQRMQACWDLGVPCGFQPASLDVRGCGVHVQNWEVG